MQALQKFWPLLVLIGVGVVALALIGLDSGKDGKDPAKEWQGPDVITTLTGLKYKEVKMGSSEEAQSGDTVSVLYTGRLASTKKVFDSTSNRNDEPFVFELGAGKVIRGWDEGVAGMRVGGIRKLLIPAQLGYGARGAGSDIPPNSDLEFEIELLKIGK
jgi:FKBP-type peptidyl-prolyl cis-trans isomerase